MTPAELRDHARRIAKTHMQDAELCLVYEDDVLAEAQATKADTEAIHR